MKRYALRKQREWAVQEPLDAVAYTFGINLRQGFPDVPLAVAMALDSLQRVYPLPRFDEEQLTAALPISIASHAEWIIPQLQGADGALSLQWTPYAKSGHRRGLDESQTGADFVLVVRVSEFFALVSIFQAKAMREFHAPRDGADASIALYRKEDASQSPHEAWQASQFVKLARYANGLLAGHGKNTSADLPAHDVAKLDWVHYLAYGSKTPLCVPLSTMADVCESSTKSRDPLTHSTHRFLQSNQTSLLEHLDTRGLSWREIDGPQGFTIWGLETARRIREKEIDPPRIPVLRGWRTFKVTDLEKLLPDLVTLTRVVVLEPTRSDLRLTVAAKLPTPRPVVPSRLEAALMSWRAANSPTPKSGLQDGSIS